jgi:hypothetical protein
MIYEINNETINGFTNTSKRYMTFISKSINFKLLGKSQIIRKTTMGICGLIFGCFSLKVCTNYLKLLKIQNNIQASNDTLKAADKRIVAEKDLWNGIKIDRYIKPCDLKKAIQKRFDQENLNHVDKIILNVDEKSGDIDVLFNINK